MLKRIKSYENLLTKKTNDFRIFLFHGVIKKNIYKIRNYNNKHILEKDFFSIIKFLKENGNNLSINQLVELIKKREIPRKSYLISFDDGFENNYSIAAPILDYFKLNATFYFSTDFVQNNSMSWIDKIEYCFEKNIDLKRIYLDKLGQFDISSLQKKKLALDQIRKIVKKNYPQNIDVFVKNFLIYLRLNILKLQIQILIKS